MDQQLKLYNTLGRRVAPFGSLVPGRVSYYTCGPTVYDYAHIGNLGTYIYEDLLKRVLTRLGYSVTHVLNITDVGHLTGDGDAGEDKLLKGAAREHKAPQEVAAFYEAAFWRDFDAINNMRPTFAPKATDYVGQIIAGVQSLLDQGYAYETDQAIYFLVAKAQDYTRLTGQRLEDKLLAAREEVVTDSAKRAPVDFAVWYKAVGRHANQLQVWDSPWGKGFPGWHMECSIMAREFLGPTIDIHAGGVDHIGTHHPNEIAQSEAMNHKPLAQWWFHTGMLSVESGKMGKSAGAFVTLTELLERTDGDTMPFRYLIIAGHYRSAHDFSWEALAGADKALQGVRELVYGAYRDNSEVVADPEQVAAVWQAILNDLDTPKAIALLHEYASGPLWVEFDDVLGLRLGAIAERAKTEVVPEAVKQLLQKREAARQSGDWGEADRLRDSIAHAGFIVIDTKDGSRVQPTQL